MQAQGSTLPTGQAIPSIPDTPKFAVGERPIPLAKPRLGFTVDETAAILDYHPNTIRAWIHNGELAAFRRGRAYYVPRESLYALLDDLNAAGVAS